MRLRVPATTANMGSGFDVVGMAIRLQNTVQFEKAKGLKVLCIGRYGQDIDNAYEVFERAFERFEEKTGKRIAGVQIIQECEIPPARGLGSSAAATAAALFIANVMSGATTPIGELLKIAVELEGHPDNVLPCMLGGLVVSFYNGERLEYERFEVPRFPLTFLVPDFKLSTEEMRRAIPETVPFKDALANLRTLALFLSRISKGRFDEALGFTSDRLHQPYRIATDSRMREIIDSIEARNPRYWFVSGSGSAICCDLPSYEEIPHLEAVVRTMPSNEPLIIEM